jgi:Tol biopolymer transport system component
MTHHLRLPLAILAVAALLAAGVAAQKTDPAAAGAMLRTAIDKAQIDGDLNGAIRHFQAIVDKYGKTDRPIVAAALVRMADCYQRLGDAQAQKIYERVVRDFGDQTDPAALARARLTRSASVAPSKSERAAWTSDNGDVDPFGQVSPDGKTITYVDWGGAWNVAYHDMATNTNRRITLKTTSMESGAAGGYSTISRDGKQVAYAWQTWGAFDSTERHSHGVYVAPLQEDGHRRARLLFSMKDDTTSGPVGLFVSPWDWSPDGKWISLEIEKRRDGFTQLALASVADGTLRVLKTLDWRGSGRAFFSPDGRYLTYRQSVNDTSNDSHVMVIAVDGSREVAAVAHPSQNYPLGWSPDGRRLLFASDRTGSFGMWSQPFGDGKPQGNPELLKADIGWVTPLGITNAGAVYVWKSVGDRDVQIAPLDLVAGKTGPHAGLSKGFVAGTTVPDWSPDGKQLAYAACDFHCIVIRSVETGESRRLPSVVYVRPPRWSPDGRSLAFNGSDFKGRNGIFVVDAATGQTTRVVEDVNTQGWPQWSADGKKIYYVADRSLRERDLPTATDRDVFRSPGLHDDVRLSPDGKTLAVTIGVDAATKVSRLTIVQVDGGEPRELMRLTVPRGFARRPRNIAWVPDGSAVIVQTEAIDPTTLDIVGRDHSELWMVPVAGAAPRKLDIDVDAWHRGSSEWFGAGFSLAPDGKRIAFLMGKFSAEIWALENFVPRGAAVTRP